MKFCPNCGRKREEENICPCGYNYETGETQEPQETPTPMVNAFGNLDLMNNMFGPEKPKAAKTLEELKKIELDLGDLLSISYTSSGGMMGSFYNDDLSFEKNTLTVTNQTWHHGERKETTYKVDEKKAQELKKILIDNNFGAWNHLPSNQSMMAWDAPTSTVYLRFEKESVSFPTIVYMDNEENDLYRKVMDMISSFCIKENIIKDEVIKPGEELNMMNQMNGMATTPFCPECGTQLANDKCPNCGHEDKHYEA